MRRVPFCEALEQRCYLSTVNINGLDTGRIFDGLGALSNSSSRLLYDYPEPQRSQILDYMFKPDYGMSLQILKVEIGGDTNSTDLAEPSFERQRGVLNFTTGFEWWLIGQAKLRNPNIKLYGLEWGAPGWFTGGFYSQDNINYLTAFLDGASSLGYNFDYLGGWNESVANPSTPAIRQWFINLRAAMNVNHANTKLVAYDDGGTNWRVADDVANYPDFGAAVDILGQHSPGVWRSQYQDYGSQMTQNALNSGKPLWASEQSAESYDVGGQSWARGIIREYVQADITAALAWNAVDAFYPSGQHADTGIMMAENPWSGYYALGSIVWVFAQTTQFTQPGWQYLDGASGKFDTGAYYVSLKSNTTNDYSTMVESMDATSAETETFNVSGGLSTGTVHVWATNVATSTLSDDFIHVADLTPVNGSFSYTIQPGYVYTFSTTTGQSKGTAAPTSTAADQMPLPYSENFDEYGASGKLAKYWQDLQGGFETAPAEGGRSGYAYRQVITTPPQSWNNYPTEPPTSMMGDMRWWGDYQFSSDVYLENSGYVELIGRIGAAPSPHVSGYHFQVSDSGAWKLYREEAGGTDTTLASGTTSFALNTWHTMSLKMTGSQIQPILDGNVLTTYTDISGEFITGNVAIRVSNLNGAYQNAEFDNVTITRTSLPPAYVPHSQMTAYASDTYSYDGGFYQGITFIAPFGIDDMPETMWQSSFNPRTNPPHWYEVDMGTAETISGIVYQPRIDNNTNGMFTQYTVYVSNDGVNFTAAASGTWPTTSASKEVTFASQQARYVQLYEGNSNLASLAELNIIQTRSSTLSTTPSLSSSSDTGASSTDKITNLNNSSPAKKLQFTVNGVTTGAVVRLYSDGTLIGTTTATSPLATITTDGITGLADGTHVITATQQVATMAESAATIGLTITIDTTAPTATVSAMPPLAGKPVAIRFSEPVVLPQGAGSIQLTNFTTGQAIPSGNIAESYSSATQTATFTFPGYTNGVLPDGNYQGQLPTTAGITDTAGNSLAANVPLGFFILTADANHDRMVNALDFNALASNYGKGGSYSQGDFDYSGTVDSNDFALLASKYGSTFSAPTGSALPANESTQMVTRSMMLQRDSLFADQPMDQIQALLDPITGGLDELI